MTNERKLFIFYVIRVVEPIFADRYHQGPSIRYPDLFCRGDLLKRQYFLLAYKPILICAGAISPPRIILE